jgi:hypothetical protein
MMTLFFQLSGMVPPISIPSCRRFLCVGFVVVLGLQPQWFFPSLSYPSMLSFRLGKHANTQLLSFFLILANLWIKPLCGCKRPLALFLHFRI